MWSQFEEKLVILNITIAIGRNIKSPMINEEAVQRFSLNRISFRKYLGNGFNFSVNNSKERLTYSQPALSNNFTASLFLFPRIDRFNLSDLNEPQLVRSSDLFLFILTGYS